MLQTAGYEQAQSEIPDGVRRLAERRGTVGVRWLDGLGGLIEELQGEWDMAVGLPLGGGIGNFVAEATTGDGVDVVVKLVVPGKDPSEPDALVHEVRALSVANGRGYVRLVAHDVDRGAMLLERLGPALSGPDLPVRDQIAILCSTLQQAWRVPADASWPSGVDKARWLAELIVDTWARLDRPCSQAPIETAVSFAKSRAAAFDPERAVLVHGDAHSSNALQDPNGEPMSYKFVDPDGLFAERAYDLAIPMRHWSAELLAGDAVELGRDRCLYLSDLTGVDPVSIWEWGFIERVSTGLHAMQSGLDVMGGEMLQVAERWATAGGWQ